MSNFSAHLQVQPLKINNFLSLKLKARFPKTDDKGIVPAVSYKQITTTEARRTTAGQCAMVYAIYIFKQATMEGTASQ